MSRIEAAKLFATQAHKGQVRKYTGDEYIVHPIAVAKIANDAMGDLSSPEVVIAALLHDTVEDTPVTIDQIQMLFGDKVAKYVWFLTDADNFIGNRKTRKAITRARLQHAPLEAKVIKLADIYHNSLSIAKYDKKFFEVFKHETRALIDAMFPDGQDYVEINW